ncbi:cytochrome c [Paenibacillus sp. P22]|uniref:c-type cytochrome n=1 Tax=Paenibacillus sp. P22 TaxID=483908 RepID=UPI000434187B|nr:cytochrome c [Paenibacillus sp. P22]CDN41853.1 hypothetical protein BN871_AN_00140 [Paenibacillus sp. P22]
MDSKKKWLLAAVLALFVLAAAACGGGSKNNGGTGNAGESTPAGNGGTTTAQAEEVYKYKSNCISCHAADLGGGVGPNLQKIGASESAENIRHQIENGGGGMPAYKGTLSDADITALTDWLASKK